MTSLFLSGMLLGFGVGLWVLYPFLRHREGEKDV